MSPRCLASMGALAAMVAVVSLTSEPAAGQAPTAAATAQGAAEKKTWTPPRTPWGEPDLRGVWGGRHQTITPLERPQEFAGREFLTDEEVAARQRAENELQAKKDALVQQGQGQELGLRGQPAAKDATITGYEYNTFWVDTGTPAKVFRRTSLIVDPPDGKIPYKPEVRKRQAYSAEVVSSRPPKNFVNASWQDRDAGERCLTDGNPGSLWSGTGPTQILQGPGYVVILGEQFRDRRVIPTDGRPHGNIRQWFGDAVGHWDGNTLVVDTTNFIDKSRNWPRDRFAQEYRTPTETMLLVERFTRTADDAIDYQITITDPAKFTRPWTIAFPFLKSPTEQAFFEYACHEGNYAMIHLLSEARSLEKEEVAKKGKKGSR